MSWLKVDDGFDTHPKLIELTEVQRWRWTRVLIHCARHRTEGHIKTSVLRELGLGRTIARLLEVGLLHENGESGYLVHDWLVYNADTVGGKVAAFLVDHPDAGANEVCRAVGGKRELVLAEVAKQRGTDPVPDRFPSGSGEPLTAGSQVVPEPVPFRYPSGSRARAPVPSRPLDQEPPSSKGVEQDVTTEEGRLSEQEALDRIGEITPVLGDLPF